MFGLRCQRLGQHDAELVAVLQGIFFFHNYVISFQRLFRVLTSKVLTSKLFHKYDGIQTVLEQGKKRRNKVNTQVNFCHRIRKSSIFAYIMLSFRWEKAS